jgi:hypothetical protein
MPWQRNARRTSSSLTKSDDGGGRSGVGSDGSWAAQAGAAPAQLPRALPRTGAAPRAPAGGLPVALAALALLRELHEPGEVELPFRWRK